MPQAACPKWMGGSGGAAACLRLEHRHPVGQLLGLGAGDAIEAQGAMLPAGRGQSGQG